MIYLYAVLPADASVPPVRGLEDSVVDGRDADGVRVAVTEHHAPPESTNESVLRHAQVIEELTRTSAAVLPARFGLVFADESTLRREVGANAPRLLTALERVHGCAEVGLRVLSAERREEQEPAGGADYLRARLRETSERDRVAASVHDVLSRHARDSTRRPPDGARLLLDAAYLVPHDDIDLFRQEVEQLGRAHPALALLCTGPWPPYSFAPAAEAAG